MNKAFIQKRFLLLIITLIGFQQSLLAVDITVDGNEKGKHIPHFWEEMVGTGTMIYCLKPEWQVAMEIGAKEAGFKRVRGHGILRGWNGTDNNNIMSLNGGTATYNWSIVDSVYDYLLSIGVRPGVELSFMPRALNNNVISPPNNYDAWRDLIKEMVLHCIDRYGEEEVTSWYWEVWNEYDYSGFWTGSREQYFNMYAKAAEGARAANSNIIIGGPVTTGAPPLQMFVDYCKKNNVPFDFLANHCYGSGPGGSTNPAAVRDDNRARSDVIKNSGKKLFSLNTEYNSTYTGQGGNSDPNVISMDNHQNAPFIVKSQKLIIDDYISGRAQLPDALSYWAISDVFDESGGNKTSWIANNNFRPFGAVFGLINYQGIRKASFNAFKMLHMMGDTLVSLSGGTGENDGVGGFATVSADGTELAVIIYNFHINLTGGGGENTVNLTVNNLPFSNGKVEVVRYLIDADHSNAYGVWSKQGKPTTPSESQWEEMREAQHLAEVESEELESADGPYTTSFTLGRHAVTQLIFKGGSTGISGQQRSRKKTLGFVRSNGAVISLTNIAKHESLRIAVFTAQGKLVHTLTCEQTPSSINFAKILPAGCYIVDIQTPCVQAMEKITIWQ